MHIHGEQEQAGTHKHQFLLPFPLTAWVSCRSQALHHVLSPPSSPSPTPYELEKPKNSTEGGAVVSHQQGEPDCK